MTYRKPYNKMSEELKKLNKELIEAKREHKIKSSTELAYKIFDIQDKITKLETEEKITTNTLIHNSL